VRLPFTNTSEKHNLILLTTREGQDDVVKGLKAGTDLGASIKSVFS